MDREFTARRQRLGAIIVTTVTIICLFTLCPQISIGSLSNNMGQLLLQIIIPFIAWSLIGKDRSAIGLIASFAIAIVAWSAYFVPAIHHYLRYLLTFQPAEWAILGLIASVYAFGYVLYLTAE